jgi:imidazolonepropionase-like amidohydrolase
MTDRIAFRRRSLAGIFALLILICLCPRPLHAAAATELLPPGFRPVPVGVHALVAARVVVKPGKVLDPATVIIRDGYIEKVGKDLTPPADARVWDMKGQTIYAGFIDPYVSFPPKTAATRPDRPTPEPDEEWNLTAGTVKFFGVSPQQREPGTEGPGYEVARVTPERRAVQTYAPDRKALEALRELGFTVANVASDKGIFRGDTALAALSDIEPDRAIIRPDVFQNVVFETGERRMGQGGAAYPQSLMGIVAVVRQTFLDAQHYSLEQAYYHKHPEHRPPEFNPSVEALAPVLEKKMTVIFEPNDALMVDRAARIAHEMDVNFCIVSSGQEWRRPELAKAAAVPFIVPLNFPTPPKLPRDEDWEQVTLDQLRVWDWAPENAAVLRKQGLEIALTAHGLAQKRDFRKNLRLALDRGLSEDDALAALTTTPAKLCGVDHMLGTVEAGRLANLTVVDGKGYFDPESKVRSVWIDGVFHRVAVADDKEEKPAAAGEEKTDTTEAAPGAEKEKSDTAAAAPKDTKGGDDRRQNAKERRQARMKELQKRVAHSPLEGRGVLTNPPAVLIRNATLWTCGPQGKLEHTDMFVQDGKIQKIGHQLFADSRIPKDTLVIQGEDLHVSPGLIDCHSHSMVLGGVNEGTLPSSAMVRIGDVLNSETPNIYDQLAGGLTVAHVLHGSANPIGGQNCPIKLRDGEPPEGLKFKEATPTIKFALGENVKQSNRIGGRGGDGGAARFPQTRMGVQTFFANRFIAAQQYLKSWADFKKSGGPPPRRDLELEALGEILEGKRLIHCHSYRQDEILMLIRLMEQFGVRIGTFQHVLEGYKVADEIAAHGAGGSTFSDWWAYKFEVYDAIPFNGSLMHDRGVVVSFNSDSDDLARRLYLEAAKAVKYGGTSEQEALKFVTLNPAIQLHVEKEVGSLELGKDADFAIWSKSPLDSFTVCQQTWIEGKKYFDVALAPARAAALAKERDDLVAKAKKMKSLGGGGGGGGGETGPSDALFFEVSLEHLYDGVQRHCLDDE